jgi:hypothetical protein
MSQEMEELQKEKVRLEIKELKRPPFLRSQFFITGIAIAGLFTQGTLSSIRSERAALGIEQANKKLATIQFIKDSTEKHLDSLKASIEALEVVKRNLTKQSNNLINVVAATSEGKLNSSIKAAVSSVENSYYSIALYGFNVNQDSFDAVKNLLSNEGYSLTNAQLLSGPRRNWLAQIPTVLYYDKQTENMAKTIAEKLRVITGQTFSLQIGAGLGVPKENLQKSLRIHFVQ